MEILVKVTVKNKTENAYMPSPTQNLVILIKIRILKLLPKMDVFKDTTNKSVDAIVMNVHVMQKFIQMEILLGRKGYLMKSLIIWDILRNQG